MKIIGGLKKKPQELTPTFLGGVLEHGVGGASGPHPQWALKTTSSMDGSHSDVLSRSPLVRQA